MYTLTRKRNTDLIFPNIKIMAYIRDVFKLMIKEAFYSKKRQKDQNSLFHSK